MALVLDLGVCELLESLLPGNCERDDANRRVAALCPKLTRGQAVGEGGRIRANPTMSHDTPRSIMLMPTRTPMIVSPDIGHALHKLICSENPPGSASAGAHTLRTTVV